MSVRISLADNVYFCVTEGQGVFLDLGADRYSAVPIPGESRTSITNKDDPESFLIQSLTPHINQLVDAGLVTAATSGKRRLDEFLRIQPVVACRGARNRRAFGRMERAGAEGSSLIAPMAFAHSCRQAARRLRRMKMLDIVNQIRVRRRACTRSGDKTWPVESPAGETASGQVEGSLDDLVDIFARLRPWYPREYLCLFDALSLLEFLAARGHFPRWVFGVQAQPFGAHCWVQAQGHALNETYEYASQFTPIMSA